MTAPKWYDFTLSREKLKERNLDGFEKVGQMFENLGADRYVLGQEVGEGGYEHYQCRVVFKMEKDYDHLKRVFAGIGHVSPTQVRDFKYCEKEGNYYRSWEKVLNKFSNISLLTWQERFIDLIQDQNDRQITVLVDEDGGIGKTTLAKKLQVNRICQYVPPMGEALDLMAFAMAKPSSGYLFDMPRSESIKQKKGMWSAIEQIKNGYLYDKRYQFRDMWIEPPKVAVFANKMPPMDALSKDRWKIYAIEWDDLAHASIPVEIACEEYQ